MVEEKDWVAFIGERDAWNVVRLYIYTEKIMQNILHRLSHFFGFNSGYVETKYQYGHVFYYHVCNTCGKKTEFDGE